MGISTMWLYFQSFPLLYTGRKCYAEASLRVSGREDLSTKSVVRMFSAKEHLSSM